jgi:hypothetical protein
VAYSQTFDFNKKTLVRNFVDEAFELCGILGPAIGGLQQASAISSLNFILSSWVNKGLNLFTEQKAMLQLNVGQPSYFLAPYAVMATEVTASNNIRQLGGAAFSNQGGTAANAFDGNASSACTQTSPGGFISYTYSPDTTPSIYYVGIQSNANRDYNLVVEYSFDRNVWFNTLTIGSLFYPLGQIIWAVINAPVNASAIRIRETGASTLDIQEIYFSTPFSSRILTTISREEWTSYPNKQVQATPSSYYIDRQINPRITLWPTPDNSYQTLVYNQEIQLMDVTSLNQNIFIPQRFMNACRLALAYEMSLKFALERSDILGGLSAAAYQEAAIEDSEKVNLRIQPNMLGY